MAQIRDIVDAPMKYRVGKTVSDFQIELKPAESTPKSDFKEIGTPGVRQQAGYVMEAYTQELTWPNAYTIYDDMRRRTPTIRALLNAVTLLAKQVSWYFEPTSGSEVDQQAAEFANTCLNDLTNPISQTVEDMLTALVFGWGWSETVFGRRTQKIKSVDSWVSNYNDGLVGWKSFEFRKQYSWHRWEFDDKTRKFKGLWQQDTPLPPVYIPLSKSIHFTPFRDGANPEGMSLLESAYEPYYYLKNYGIILGVGMERSVTGWPVFTYASKPSPDDRNNIEMAARALLAGSESAYMSLPPGATFKFENVTNTNANTILEIMRYYNVLILQMMLADFIWMGAGSTGGSYGLGQDKSVLFIMAVNGILDSLADAINSSAVQKLFQYNDFPGLVSTPRLVHSPVRKPISLGELGSFISSISTIIPLSMDDQAAIRSYSNGVLSPQAVEPPAPTQVDPMTGLPIPEPVNPIITPGQVGDTVPTNKDGAVTDSGNGATANPQEFSLPKISELSYLKRNHQSIVVDYETDLGGPVYDFMHGDKPKEEAKKDFNMVMLSYLPEAFWRGYSDAGGDLMTITPEVESMLTKLLQEEFEFSDKFWDRVSLAKELPPENGAVIEPTMDLWVNTLAGVYSMGKAAGAPDALLTFTRVAHTKDQCRTCVSLEGKRHTAKWYADRGYIPMPGCNLDCGGYHCGHELQDDNGEAWLSLTPYREVNEAELSTYFDHKHGD